MLTTMYKYCSTGFLLLYMFVDAEATTCTKDYFPYSTFYCKGSCCGNQCCTLNSANYYWAYSLVALIPLFLIICCMVQRQRLQQRRACNHAAANGVTVVNTQCGVANPGFGAYSATYHPTQYGQVPYPIGSQPPYPIGSQSPYPIGSQPPYPIGSQVPPIGYCPPCSPTGHAQTGIPSHLQYGAPGQGAAPPPYSEVATAPPPYTNQDNYQDRKTTE